MDVQKLEVFGSTIEVEYVDGSKEEIENGRYQRKDTNGDTVEERPATDADAERLAALIGDAIELEILVDGGVIVEVEPGKIEAQYPDGSREEIEGGVYERYNSAGVTVEERAATQEDIDRLQALVPTSVSIDPPSGGGQPPANDDGDGPPPPGSDVAKVEIIGTNIEVTYADGSKEEIEYGRYERKNTAGVTVEERAATDADAERLGALIDDAVELEVQLEDGSIVETAPGKIEILYPDGTKEEIEGGIYERYDANGVTVEERPATDADIARLEALIPADAPARSPSANSGADEGAKVYNGDDDRDEYLGEDDDDEIYGNGGDDFTRGRKGDDTMDGGAGDDLVRGDQGDDRIGGGSGKDIVRGGAGHDYVEGGDDDDIISGDAGHDEVHGGAGNDVVRGGADDDIIYGDDGDDRVIGDRGDDVAHGGHGDDVIKGWIGDDVVMGGAGSDILWGNTGADRFVFKGGDERDVVKDFDDGLDLLDVSAHGYVSVEDVLEAASDGANGVMLNFGDGDYAILRNMTKDELDADDFIF
ncbi:MAG: hypothetical protein KTR21_10780 [Rhodobacteraceae bacterium]|nr:hypothetical protein [Paracoccaceae bacterium]